jgi:hypothetical protein
MAQDIKLKRSATAAKVPLTTDLELGELAINTYDGKLYLKKDDGTEAIVDVTATGGGASDLSSLTDTTISSPTSDQVLTWNGSAWVNADAAAGGSSASELYPAGTWVKENTTSTGTGDASLSSAITGFLRFSDTFSENDEIYYHIEDGLAWEIGKGTIAIDGTPAPYRYWRLNITASQDESDYLGIAEWELRATIGGADQITGGTVSTSSNHASYPASQAVNNNSSDIWLTESGVTAATLTYDFGAGNEVAVAEYSIQVAAPALNGRSPKSWTLEYSSDGTTWNVADTRTNELTFSTTAVRSFTAVNTPQQGTDLKLVRDTVLHSSNSDALISLSGSATVSASIPAEAAAAIRSSLESLDDLSISVSPAAGDYLTYDGTISKWKNTSLAQDIAYLYTDTVDADPTGTGLGSLIIGDGAEAGDNNDCIVIGSSAKIDGSNKDNCVILGNGAGVLSANFASNVIAIGNGAGVPDQTNTTSWYDCLYIGTGAGAFSGNYTGSSRQICIGHFANSLGSDNICIGPSTKTGGATSVVTSSIAIGNNASSQANSAVAIGYAVTNNDANSIRIGYISSNTMHLKDNGTLNLEGTKAQYVLPSYTVATLPTGVTGGQIFVTDETGGSIPAFYDGTNWRRVTDRAIVS